LLFDIPLEDAKIVYVVAEIFPFGCCVSDPDTKDIINKPVEV